MTSSWVVPDALRQRMITENLPGWVEELPTIAEQLSERWALRPDGQAWSGFWSAVWPVVDESGQRLALKFTTAGDGRHDEAAALRVWAGHGCVRLLAEDSDSQALLLERLDGNRTLETHPDIDEATMIIAGLLADLGGQQAPPGIRPFTELVETMTDGIGRYVPSPDVPQVSIDRALETLRWLAAGPTDSWVLLHADCHYLNVLASLPGEVPRWAIIDPLPYVGPPELEPVPLLRNRFADAVATGDPDRALRRRVDVIADRTGMDAELARRISQAIAVWRLLADNSLSQFVDPYRVLSRW